MNGMEKKYIMMMMKSKNVLESMIRQNFLTVTIPFFWLLEIRYSFLFKLDIDNYEKWAKGLKKAGYATDPKYPKKLIDLIERYDLDKYDNLVLKRKNKTYRVKKGETLYSIAKKFDMTTENLKALNGIEENEISVGDRLRVKK